MELGDFLPFILGLKQKVGLIAVKLTVR